MASVRTWLQGYLHRPINGDEAIDLSTEEARLMFGTLQNALAQIRLGAPMSVLKSIVGRRIVYSDLEWLSLECLQILVRFSHTLGPVLRGEQQEWVQWAVELERRAMRRAELLPGNASSSREQTSNLFPHIPSTYGPPHARSLFSTPHHPYELSPSSGQAWGPGPSSRNTQQAAAPASHVPVSSHTQPADPPTPARPRTSANIPIPRPPGLDDYPLRRRFLHLYRRRERSRNEYRRIQQELDGFLPHLLGRDQHDWYEEARAEARSIRDGIRQHDESIRGILESIDLSEREFLRWGWAHDLILGGQRRMDPPRYGAPRGGVEPGIHVSFTPLEQGREIRVDALFVPPVRGSDNRGMTG